MRDPVLRHALGGLAERVVGRDHHEGRDCGGAGGDRVEVELRRRDEVEVGDDAPKTRGLVVLVLVLEDEDRVDAERRHHPGYRAERRLGRAADDAAAHGVAHLRGLERHRESFLGTMLDVDHAAMLRAGTRRGIRTNYGTAGVAAADRRATPVRCAASATAAATAGATARLKTL